MSQPAPISVPKGYQRLGAFPLDASSVFETLAALQTYASTNGTAYAGQVCAVSGTGKVYVLQSDKSLLELGGGGGGGGAPAAHAASHATGGSDPISPASIGAAAEGHTHALSALTQSAATTGQVPTWNGTAWTPATPSAGSATVVAITSGGTGATTAAAALTNLGAAASTHTHGNITNAGAIGSTASLPIITGTSGVLQAGSFGTAAGTFCQGNDARLSDSRTPLAHTHGNITNAGAIGSTASLPIITGTSGVLQAGSFGTAAGTFAQGNHTHGNITNAGAIGSTSGVPIITGTSGVLQAGSFGTAAGTFCQGNDSRVLDIVNKLGVTSSSYVIAVPGDDLATKYSQAKSLTPNGSALSSTNRAALIIYPGKYGSLTVDAEFVDIIGLGAQTKSQSVFLNGISVTANDVRVSGINSGSGSIGIPGNRPLQVFENCSAGDSSFGYGGIDYTGSADGTFINCTAGNYSFGGGGCSASGTFIGCTAGSRSFGGWGSIASGTFTNCTSGIQSFGHQGTASGIFTNCTGQDSCFGAGGTASGTFTNCTSGIQSFGGQSFGGGTASGTFIGCKITLGSFPQLTTPATGKALMLNCIDGNGDIINGEA